MISLVECRDQTVETLKTSQFGWLECEPWRIKRVLWNGGRRIVSGDDAAKRPLISMMKADVYQQT